MQTTRNCKSALDVRDTVLVPIGLPLPPSELMLAVRLVERSYVAPIRDTDTAIPIRRYCDMAFFKNKDTPIRQVYKYKKKQNIDMASTMKHLTYLVSH